MKAFLQEYWLWILIPFVLMGCLLLAVLFMANGEGSSPFIYNIF
ncbi:MAG: hypothetical protein ACI8QS_003775 [Planctomycetota bacterium]|jgi:hypothetical protein